MEAEKALYAIMGLAIKYQTLRLLSIITHPMPSPPLRQDAHLVLPSLCGPHRESLLCRTVRSLIRKSQSSTLQGSALEADDDRNFIPSLLILLADPRRAGRKLNKEYMLMEFLTINPPTESVHLPQGPRGNLPRENLLILHRHPHRRPKVRVPTHHLQSSPLATNPPPWTPSRRNWKSYRKQFRRLVVLEETPSIGLVWLHKYKNKDSPLVLVHLQDLAHFSSSNRHKPGGGFHLAKCQPRLSS